MSEKDAELLRSHLNIALRGLSQARIRDFGGYAVGKRRKLHVVEPMARDVAAFLCRYMNAKANGQPATVEGVANAIASALRNVSDETAYKLTARDYNTWTDLCEAVATFLERCMEFHGKPYDGSLTALSESNGWKMWEMIQSGEQPKGRWRHSWAEKPGDDFTGLYGNACMGRIFKIDLPGYADRWFWLAAADGDQRRGWPAAGYEASAKSAACRVERIYFALLAGKSKTGS
ncbi:hypothetical protein [Rhizobium leguminosarum]|uniref:hypothetical protein n=1 Tax=Rhizobium leguminosarum TaxID=384 RepID=UPI003F9CC5AC